MKRNKIFSKNTHITSFFAVACLCIMCISPAHSAMIQIDTSVGNGADSYISTWPGEQTQNFGDAEGLYLKNDAGTGFVNRKVYLRFDLSSITTPITDASLCLSFLEDTDPSGGIRTFNVYSLVDGHPGENWDESTINWNNAPANNTSSGSGLISGQYAALGSFQFNSTSATSGDQAMFSSAALTSVLQNDSDDMLTLIIVRQDRTLSNIAFSSKENQILSGPIMKVNTVPIPVAFWLLASGLIGVVGLKKNIKRR